MKKIICDQCNDVIKSGKNKIYLEGYRPKVNAGILLPDRLMKFDFCSDECFERWLGMEKKTMEPKPNEETEKHSAPNKWQRYGPISRPQEKKMNFTEPINKKCPDDQCKGSVFPWREFRDFTYCPYCGKKLKVIDDSHGKKEQKD